MNALDGRRFGIAVVATVAATTLSMFGLTVSGSDDPGGAAFMGPAAPTRVVTDASDPRWPTSIANRKVLDQYGDVYLIRTFSSWGMASNLSDAEITSALEGVAGNGFDGVTVWFGGGAYYGEDWSPTYQHKATSEAFWNGTPWASGLGPAWASLDHLVAEAKRLGIFVWMSLNSGLGVPRAEFEAVTNTDMYNAGAAVATRYLAAPNVGWHVMIDDPSVTTGGTVGQRIDAFFHGVNDTEGASTRPVRWLEVGGGNSTNEQGWLGTTNFNATINSWYEFWINSTEIAEAGYAEVPTVPVGDCEPPYDGAPHYGNYGADADQELRERSYATFLEGGSLINYGHEDWWRFGLSGLYSEGLTWQQVQGHSHTVQQSYAWKLLDEFVADLTWAPDDGSFLTTGTGSGDTKAAAGRSDTAAVAYFPSSRDVVVDTTVIAGSNPVRLRWFDPTTSSYVDISDSETQRTDRSVSSPSARQDGTSDWVLVVDLAGGMTPPTTILPRAVEPTTTAVEPTTTAVEPTTTAVEPTTTAVEPTTTAVEPTTTAVEPTTTAVEPTTTAVEPTTTAVEPTTTCEWSRRRQPSRRPCPVRRVRSPRLVPTSPPFSLGRSRCPIVVQRSPITSCSAPPTGDEPGPRSMTASPPPASSPSTDSPTVTAIGSESPPSTASVEDPGRRWRPPCPVRRVSSPCAVPTSPPFSPGWSRCPMVVQR